MKRGYHTLFDYYNKMLFLEVEQQASNTQRCQYVEDAYATGFNPGWYVVFNDTSTPNRNNIPLNIVLPTTP